jgi:cell division protein FtsL
MNRLAMLLLLTLMGCALAAITIQNRVRSLSIALDRTEVEERQLQQDWLRLQYEQSDLSKSARVMDFSRTHLSLIPAAAGRTHYLSPNGQTLRNPDPPPPPPPGEKGDKKGGH